jgi:hypothetical protein
LAKQNGLKDAGQDERPMMQDLDLKDRFTDMGQFPGHKTHQPGHKAGWMGCGILGS